MNIRPNCDYNNGTALWSFVTHVLCSGLPGHGGGRGETAEEMT